MTTMTATNISAWPRQAEAWLDERGKGAWIAAMVLGFIVFWPVGLAILAYMIWSKRMFSKSCTSRRHRHGSYRMAPSGNTAFDNYRSETLRRLEDEQAAFESFLQRLRDARDKAEFDSFMEERARAAREGRGGERDEDAPHEPRPGGGPGYGGPGFTGSGAY